MTPPFCCENAQPLLHPKLKRKVEPGGLQRQLSFSPGARGAVGVGMSHGCEKPAAMGWSRDERLKARSAEREFLGDLAGSMLGCLFSLPPQSVVKMQDHSKEGIFPLPLPRGLAPTCKKIAEWEEGIIRSLNFLSTGSFALGEGVPSRLQEVLLGEIRSSLPVVQVWQTVPLENFDVKEFWKQKHVNSYGVEVHVAQSFRWENIDESLPKAELTGVVPAAEVCTGGMLDFVLHPAKWLKPLKERTWMKSPRIMIPSEAWDQVVDGLIARNLCGVLPEGSVFCVDNQPIFGGIIWGP